MPAWSTEQGGSLNPFQIQQLVALITGTMPGFSVEDNPDPNAISEEAWRHAYERANHAAVFDPPKQLAEAVGPDDTTLVLNDASLLVEEATIRLGGDPEEAYELVLVTSVPDEGNEIEVERGTLDTDAAEHDAGTPVYQGPVPPADTITGATGTPPCGQLPPREDGGEAETVTLADTAAIQLGDNFFEIDGKQNPTLAVAPGQSVSVALTSTGSQPHNMRTTGADAEFDNDDDAVSDPDLIPGGGTGSLNFSFAEAGTYEYRCDFHPDQMRGEIAVGQ
jgi:plastocyanin